MNFLKIGLLGMGALVLTPLLAVAQPQTPLVGTNTACATGPTLVGGQPDTLNLPADDSGFVPLFNGKNLKGWWEGCGSGHSSADKTYGGIWLVDSNTGVLFANQNTNGAGSVLMTNKSYGNYEIMFDLWPSFGDDGGLFNRVTAAGTCYQTTIDYIQGSSLGGVYFENGYTGAGRNYDPFVFGAAKQTITIGTNSNVNNRLDSLTKRFGTPLDYGCTVNGCTPANWTAIWDTGGWNQMRVQFFGTGASATNKVHNFARVRKLGAAHWIPTIRDSVQFNTPANPIGFQIHGGTGSWGNRNGHWYRNIKIRPLTDQGVPILPPVSVARSTVKRADFRAVSGALSGTVDASFEITVRDASGRALEKFSGSAGTFHHILGPQTKGILLVEIKTAHGVESLRLSRVFE